MRLAAPSRVGSDSVYDYIIAEMSKAVKKQVLCIAPCYFAQSGSKDLRQRQAARARRSQSTLGRRRAHRAGQSAPTRRGAKGEESSQE